MARRKRETLNVLLAPIIKAERFTEWCVANDLLPFTVLRLRNGEHDASAGTVALLVVGLVAEGILPADGGRANWDRVRSACSASRDARQR